MLALLSIFYTIICGDFSMKIMSIATKLVYMIRFYHTIYTKNKKLLCLFLLSTLRVSAYGDIDSFLQPLQFTKTGIAHFFSSTFN